MGYPVENQGNGCDICAARWQQLIDIKSAMANNRVILFTGIQASADEKNFHMRNRKNITRVLLLLFLLATVATAFHYHHDDESTHHDCPVCAAGHHYSSASVNSFDLEINQTVASYEICTVSLFVDSVRSALLPSRAPPA